MNAQALISALIKSGTLNKETETALEKAVNALDLMAQLEGYFKVNDTTPVKITQPEMVEQAVTGLEQEVDSGPEEPAFIQEVPAFDEVPQSIEALVDDVSGQLDVPVQRHTASKPKAAPSTGAGAKWTPEEDERLKSEFTRGMNATKMAEVHGRSVPSILIRLCDKHKLISEKKKDELIKKYRAQQAAGAPSASTPVNSEKGLSAEEVENQMEQFIHNKF